jgi:hypothetical protein
MNIASAAVQMFQYAVVPGLKFLGEKLAEKAVDEAASELVKAVVSWLRRAFQLAGAKTVIMSLWPVEDKTTEQWMATLYREHFLNGKDTGKSLRAASLQILSQHRAKHQSTHPFYWGAFIAAGDWH